MVCYCLCVPHFLAQVNKTMARKNRPCCSFEGGCTNKARKGGDNVLTITYSLIKEHSRFDSSPLWPLNLLTLIHDIKVLDKSVSKEFLTEQTNNTDTLVISTYVFVLEIFIVSYSICILRFFWRNAAQSNRPFVYTEDGDARPRVSWSNAAESRIVLCNARVGVR